MLYAKRFSFYYMVIRLPFLKVPRISVNIIFRFLNFQLIFFLLALPSFPFQTSFFLFIWVHSLLISFFLLITHLQKRILYLVFWSHKQAWPIVHLWKGGVRRKRDKVLRMWRKCYNLWLRMQRHQLCLTALIPKQKDLNNRIFILKWYGMRKYLFPIIYYSIICKNDIQRQWWDQLTIWNCFGIDPSILWSVHLWDSLVQSLWWRTAH